MDQNHRSYDVFFNAKPEEMFRARGLLPVGGSVKVFGLDISLAYDEVSSFNQSRPNAIVLIPEFPGSKANFEYDVVPYERLK